MTSRGRLRSAWKTCRRASALRPPRSRPTKTARISLSSPNRLATVSGQAREAPPLKLIARATIDGKEVVREAMGGLPKVLEPGDIVTTTGQTEVAVKPGGEARLTVKVERRNGFKGRIPLDVKGLPHGIHVLDIGLNGILITPEETSRTIVIYAEPWVEATTHPFVVLARREGKKTEHAAKSVLLRVAK